MSKDTDLVHAKYLGGTPVVMPDLIGRPRCCDEHNHREDDPEGKPNPHALLQQGDVVLLDRYSAENREDFEVVDDVVKPRKSRAKKPAAPQSSLSTGHTEKPAPAQPE